MGPGSAATIAATVVVFTIMVSLGLGTRLGDIRGELSRPLLLLRALFAVLFVVPAIAVSIAWALGLDWSAQVGIVLMTIAPAAPVALRRSISAGSHRGFAATLQIAASMLAVITMPLFVAVLNPLYSGRASIAPADVAGQVTIMQLLPLGIGMAVKWFWHDVAERIAPPLSRIAEIMLVLFLVALLASIWRDVLFAGPGTILAIVLITALALAAGHAAGAPERTTRVATAITCAARNAGLVLLLLSVNAPRPEVAATVMAYVVWSAVVVTVYLALAGRQR